MANEFDFQIVPTWQLENSAANARVVAETNLGYAGLANQREMQEAQLAYLRERMRLLEIPEMQMTDERTRHQMALGFVNDMAGQLGWMIPIQNLDFLYNPDRSKQGVSGAPSPERMLQGAVPTMEMQKMMGNPRYLASSLMAGGATPEQAGTTMSNLPLIRNLVNSAYAPALTTPTATGQNPNFQFIQGHQMNPQQGVQALQTQGPEYQLLSGAASFSGQEPESWWNEFQRRLPQGQVAPATSYA